MTATSAASMAIVLPLANSVPDRSVQQEGQGSGGADWQRALQTASSQAEPASTAAAAQASYLLALGNLDVDPVEVLPAALATLPQPASPVPVSSPQDAGQGAQAQAAEPSPAAPATHARAAAHKGAKSAVAARHASPDVSRRWLVSANAAAQPGAAEVRDGPSSASKPAASRRATSSQADRPETVPVPHSAFAAQAAHAITAYAAAMSGAPPAADREADFSFTPQSTKVPVRVHVQWRDRVADIWIGLHRQAFDQLPDVHAGVRAWVTSRGGVLGHVVCNGETLARVAPTFDFLGAL